MIAIKDMEMPENCIECNRKDLQQAINCQLIYSGCANCGRHPNCPLVEVEERKVGKWIIDIGEKEFNRERVDACHCSVCNKDPLNFVYASEDWYTYADKLPSNCPNCGCRMTKED